MRRFRLALGLALGAVALVLADRHFGSSGVGSTEPPGAGVPAPPAPEREQ